MTIRSSQRSRLFPATAAAASTTNLPSYAYPTAPSSSVKGSLTAKSNPPPLYSRTKSMPTTTGVTPPHPSTTAVAASNAGHPSTPHPKAGIRLPDPASTTYHSKQQDSWRDVANTYVWGLSQQEQNAKAASRLDSAGVTCAGRPSNRKTEKWVREQATYYVSVPFSEDAKYGAAGGGEVSSHAAGTGTGKENIVPPAGGQQQRWHINAGIEIQRTRTRNLWNDVMDRWIRRQTEKEMKRVERELEREKERERMKERERERQRRKLEEEAAQARQKQQQQRQQRETEKKRAEQERADAEARRAKWYHYYASTNGAQQQQQQQRSRRSASVDRERRPNMADAWNRYQLRWEELSMMSHSSHLRSRSESPGSLTFSSIPWPLPNPPLSPSHISPSQIASFILSPQHSQDQTRKERLRNAQLRWHPDRFRPRVMAKVAESEREKVEEGVGIVARCLNDLMSRENSTSVSETHLPRMRPQRSQTR